MPNVEVKLIKKTFNSISAAQTYSSNTPGRIVFDETHNVICVDGEIYGGGGLPSVTSSDNGKILVVSNGEWSLVTPISVYSGSSEPNNNQGINGDIYMKTT